MLSLHSVEAQICIAHAESKGCFTSLDPCSISTYVSFESLLQIFFFSIPLSSQKKKKKKSLNSPYFPAPFLPVCKHAQDESLHNYIPIAGILPLALPFRSFRACLPIEPNMWGWFCAGVQKCQGKPFSWGHPRASSPCYDPRSGLRRREGVAGFGGNGGC